MVQIAWILSFKNSIMTKIAPIMPLNASKMPIENQLYRYLRKKIHPITQLFHQNQSQSMKKKDYAIQINNYLQKINDYAHKINNNSKEKNDYVKETKDYSNEIQSNTGKIRGNAHKKIPPSLYCLFANCLLACFPLCLVFTIASLPIASLPCIHSTFKMVTEFTEA